MFDNVRSFLQVCFVNEIFVFYFSSPCFKERNKHHLFESGLQIAHLDRLCNAGASAWQAERLFQFNKLWDCRGLSQKAVPLEISCNASNSP